MSHDQAAAADPTIEPGDFAEAAEPFALFESWLADAARHEPNDPNAMALATVDAAGHPNVRMVLLKAVDPADHAARGFVFFTNYDSAKGRELIANPHAALDFHWKSLHRQVRVRGLVTQTTPAEADAYFATRPRSAQIGAWASQQSRPLESRYALEKAFAARGGKIPDRHGAASALLVGLSHHAAGDRVLAQPAVSPARAHRFQAARARRRLAQNAPLPLRTVIVRGCLDPVAASGQTGQGAGTIDACQRAFDRSARPWC